MAGEWLDCSVGDITAPLRNALVGGPFGSNLVSADYVDSGVPVIRGQNMGKRWVDGEFAYVTRDKAISLEANLARPGDVVFTQRGTLGQVSLVPSGGPEVFLLSQSQMKLTPDPQKAVALYLYYLFTSREQQEYVRQHAIQTGVPHTNLGILRHTPICLPPLDEQTAIAAILGRLDDKIELNRKVNETLEAMARALFKSWFVDFDPVRAKAEGRDPGLPSPIADLFPDSFEDSELGEIPRGWQVGSVADLAQLQKENISPGMRPEEVFTHFSIPAYDNGKGPTIERGSAIKSNKFSVPPDAILVSKLNPAIPRVWLVDIADSERPICSTEFLVVTPQSPQSREFLYLLFECDTIRRHLLGLATGTSNSHQRVRPEGLLGARIVLPDELLLAQFSKLARPLLTRVTANIHESANLAALRDALLPKLVSGELRVPDAVRTLGGPE